MKERFLPLLVVFLSVSFLAGCATRGQLKSRDEQIESLRQQLDEAQKQCGILEEEKKEAEARAKELEHELNELSDRLKIEMEQNEKYSMLRVPEKLLFNLSQVRLSSNGKKLLDDIAGILKKYPEYDVRVEGHTDNKKIKPEFYDKFRSNWELSTARATEVVRYLVNNKGIEPKRMVAVGYGEYRPIDSNDTAAGRSKNRRVEFFIAPKMPYKEIGG